MKFSREPPSRAAPGRGRHIHALASVSTDRRVTPSLPLPIPSTCAHARARLQGDFREGGLRLVDGLPFSQVLWNGFDEPAAHLRLASVHLMPLMRREPTRTPRALELAVGQGPVRAGCVCF